MLRLGVGLFLIVLPVLELVLLVRAGHVIGVWATVALVVGAAFVGAAIVSRQSFTVLGRSLEAMSEGRLPGAAVLDSLFLMLAGVLLLTPGFITDALALILLIPPLRRIIARWSIRQVLNRTDARVEVNERTSHARRPGTRADPPSGTHDGPVIEGEFERLSDKSPNNPV